MMVTVFEPVDAGHQMLVEAVLKEAEIYYVCRNAELQNLIGWGQIGGLNVATGGIKIQVPYEDEVSARELIRKALGPGHVNKSHARPSASDGESSDETEGPAERADRYSNVSLVCSIFWMVGLGSLAGIFMGVRALAIEEIRGGSRGKALTGVGLGLGGLLLLGVLVWG
ncbi:MAG: hypothetical protein K8J08_04070 [Thermoanaerobaculia bacterium]|nr:hypothetical protein [Thermoanaerobaculia bacterium]